jgi:hypothetical protein
MRGDRIEPVSTVRELGNPFASPSYTRLCGKAFVSHIE